MDSSPLELVATSVAFSIRSRTLGRACIIRNLDCWFHRCGAALVTEIKYQPPFWVHALLWVPLMLAVPLGPLRGLKGLLFALQYHYKASEKRLAPRFGVC